MAEIERLFSTVLYRSRLAGKGSGRLIADLRGACLAVARDDAAGRAWCRSNGYRGYTSYASLNDLAWRDPRFAELVGHLDGHVAAFSRAAGFDLGGKRLGLDSLWINVLEPGGAHGLHLHPGSVVSGTLYLDVPPGAQGLKLEDPRLGLMMAAPARRRRIARDLQPFVTIVPEPGTLLLWESWLRHEVPANRARRRRISISFNYR
jgi:uncharacterized protein (TIGR02466 family)